MNLPPANVVCAQSSQAAKFDAPCCACCARLKALLDRQLRSITTLI